MNMKNKKFVASYSGGKDSILAIYRAINQGMKPMALIITYNTDVDRSWFHGMPEHTLDEVSKSLNIPIKLIKTSGKEYADNFKKELREQKKNGAEVCVFGDIDIEGHLEWCTNICKESDIEAYFPLWQESREKLVREFIAEGFTANITVVDTTRLSDKHLGRILSEETIQSISEEGADICGENGEYHSFVSDGPIFSYPIPFSYGEKIVQDQFARLPICESLQISK